MKILVAIKQVATLDEDFQIRGDGRDIEEDFLVRDLNEWDDYSLEEALRLKEAAGGALEVIAATVAGEQADEALRKCLAKGADRAVRVWDEQLADSDPIGIARVLAALTRREAPELLFAGVQSSDQAFAATGIATAALLDWPHAAVITRLEYTPGARSAVVQRELEGGVLHELQIECPAVLTIQLGINTPRYASLRAIKQAATRPIEALSTTELGLAADQLGQAGSASRVRCMYIPERSRARMIEGSIDEQASELARLIRERTGGTA